MARIVTTRSPRSTEWHPREIRNRNDERLDTADVKVPHRPAHARNQRRQRAPHRLVLAPMRSALDRPPIRNLKNSGIVGFRRVDPELHGGWRTSCFRSPRLCSCLLRLGADGAQVDAYGCLGPAT